jgi:hypothetical protein
VRHQRTRADWESEPCAAAVTVTEQAVPLGRTAEVSMLKLTPVWPESRTVLVPLPRCIVTTTELPPVVAEPVSRLPLPSATHDNRVTSGALATGEDALGDGSRGAAVRGAEGGAGTRVVVIGVDSRCRVVRRGTAIGFATSVRGGTVTAGRAGGRVTVTVAVVVAVTTWTGSGRGGVSIVGNDVGVALDSWGLIVAPGGWRTAAVVAPPTSSVPAQPTAASSIRGIWRGADLGGTSNGTGDRGSQLIADTLCGGDAPHG